MGFGDLEEEDGESMNFKEKAILSRLVINQIKLFPNTKQLIKFKVRKL